MLKLQKAGSDPGLFVFGLSSNGSGDSRFNPASKKPRRDPFRFSRAGENAALQRIEPVGGGEKAKALFIAHHDACSFRTDFDDVSVRHVPAHCPTDWNSSGPLTPGEKKGFVSFGALIFRLRRLFRHPPSDSYACRGPKFCSGIRPEMTLGRATHDTRMCKSPKL